MQKNQVASGDQKELLVLQYLEVFLRRDVSPGDRHLHVRLFLEEHSGAEARALEDVDDDLRRQLPEDASPEDWENGRVEIMAQLIWNAAPWDQRDEWYRMAKAEEELDGLI